MTSTLRTICRDLNSPDDSRGDWYGWMTNKASHIGLGFRLAVVKLKYKSGVTIRLPLF